MNRADQAAALHAQGANCAQSVLVSFAPELGVDAETALRLATGFGAGMGRMAGTCGAVTGGFMVLGLAAGMRTTGDRGAKEDTYARVRELSAAFAARNSTTTCRELLGVDIATEEGMNAARTAGLFTTRCNGYIRDVVELLDAMLLPARGGS